jgi:RNA polymerase sigma-70 factor (ECF subfamily)
MTTLGMDPPALDAHTDDALDAALLARWRGGDDRAATELVSRHAPAVARFVASLGERHDADELVQDTFVRAFQAIAGFRADSSLRTWLFTIARRLVLDRRRVGARRWARETDAPGVDVSVDPHTALDAVVADETGTRLRAAMARLTPMQREVFTLRVSEGRSYREIAEIAGTTEGSARVHYHNAVKAVKELLDA